MDKGRRQFWVRGLSIVAVLGLVTATAPPALGGATYNVLLGAFKFPLSFANGVAGDLIVPVGSVSKLSFDSGKVAVGNLPATTLTEHSGPRRRSRALRFTPPSGPAPRARLLLNGVIDADGNLVSNTGNQLLIDATVSSGGAAQTPQPFTFPFDINGGLAFVDVALPIPVPADGSVRVQIVGVTVVDPDGQAFATLGFELPAARPTPPPSFTPAATATPPLDCSDRPRCDGPCVMACPDGSIQRGVCETDTSCHCGATCGPPPSPTPGACANTAICGEPCIVTCADGTTVAGQCAADQNATCQCAAVCVAPTPCGIGECFDTITLSCTGQPCDAALRCRLPNQFCDVSGRRCPCQPPRPLPHGHICCQCKDQGPACFDFSYAEVQPICPPGCDTFLGHECDRASDACLPLAPCTADQDCDDGNGCTIDRCTTSGCTHDCVCVGPEACGPGPAHRSH